MAGWPASIHTPVALEVHTAAHHAELRDALLALQPQTARIATLETRLNAAFGALATPGPALTLTTGTKVLVIVSADLFNDTLAAFTYMGVAVSGATTRAADDIHALMLKSGAIADRMQACQTFELTGLTAGVNTFTCQYRSSAGTASYQNRMLTIIAA